MCNEKNNYLHELPSIYNGRSAVWLYNELEVKNETVVSLDKRHTLELKDYDIIDKATLKNNCIEGNGRLNMF